MRWWVCGDVEASLRGFSFFVARYTGKLQVMVMVKVYEKDREVAGIL